tara:strand:- start:142 stop:1056 length:915 start_codon:yes stop_codon:yes gene_type:complete
MKKITIITSVYNADNLLNNFLKHITSLHGFELCRLLLYNVTDSHINPQIILKYIENYKKKYDNIEHILIKQDPGLYEIWNMGIRESDTEFITNANLDDFRHPYYLLKGLYFLENKLVDLYSTNYYTTKQLPTKWDDINKIKIDKITKKKIKAKYPSLNKQYLYKFDNMFKLNKDFTYVKKCYPHCAPIWRRKLHIMDGEIKILFNERDFGACADYEFWIRASKYHNSKFLLDYNPMLLYYEGKNNYGVIGKIKYLKLEKEIYQSIIFKNFIEMNKSKYHSKCKLLNMGIHNYLNIKIMSRYINN